MRLLCVGDINLDIITPKVSYFPLKDEQLIVDNFKWFLGGSSTITACAAASLGVDTTLAGCVGSDFIGDMLLSKLKSYGVKSLVKRGETPTETTFAVTFESTSRSFITTVGANKDLSLADIPSFDGFSHLHLASFYHLHGLQKDFPRLITSAKKAGLTVSFDPGLVAGANPNLAKKLFSLIDVLFLNELELRRFGGMLFCGKQAPLIAVHLGPEGSVVHKGSVKFSLPAFKGKVLNSTGAGDVYNAGFLKEFMKGADPKSCLESGVKAASFYIKQKEQLFPTE